MYRRQTAARRLRQRRGGTRRMLHQTIEPSFEQLYIQQLQQLYPQCKRDDDRDTLTNKYEGHRITYGEMNYDGLEKLFQHVLNFDNSDSFRFNPRCFIDVGSGRGKLCLYMAGKSSIDQVLGIELVDARHQDAEQLKHSLSDYSCTKKVRFLNSSIFDISLRSLVRTGPVFVWFSNLCFDQNITDDIYQKLVNELPVGSIICSSKIPNIELPNCINMGSIEIDMSWKSGSNVNIFQIIN
uniref:DOT1 domain-containing protein n=1 Tax=viral metagenome TaxID=1070528 RepID=A0A6C0D431_9ZZZZ